MMSNPLSLKRFLLASLLVFSIFIFSSCDKTSTDTTTNAGNWARRSEFEGSVRTEAFSFVINNVLYIGGGYDGNNRLTDFWKLDEPSGTWKQLGNLPGDARNSAVGFSIGDKGYFGTGYNGTVPLKDFYEYDPATDTWTKKADFPSTARYDAVAFSVNNNGYIGTGFDSTGTYRKDFYKYDPNSDTWTQSASLAGDKRSQAVAFVDNNIPYVVSGINNGTYLNDMWAYDAANDSWIQKRKITTAVDDADSTFDDSYGANITRSNASVFVMNDTAYLVGGNYNGIIGTTWAYDIKTDYWFAKTSFEGTARQGAVGFTVNNHGYIATGANSSNYFDDLWEFYPAETQNSDDN
ncbi:Kelch repeat-containing protein [Ferruginibacter albus]|uniref:Kelch repeat-containing protein n=1 Tax=Ferruginibacter albus TaxID=2875540 RepID=UPI001CC61905|nr:kelch repeat-containing protein [Ferruginibacter albus]UAY53571.1 hypothetical protein K9M53_07865 [Ferruginibacter albus]